MVSPRRVSLGLLGGLAACGAPAPDAACEGRLAELSAVLATLPESSGPTVDDARELPTSARGAPSARHGVPLSVDAGGQVSLDGRALDPRSTYVVFDELHRTLHFARHIAARDKADAGAPKEAKAFDLEEMMNDPRLVGSLNDRQPAAEPPPPVPAELREQGVALQVALPAAAPVAPLLALLAALPEGLPVELLVRDEALAKTPAWLGSKLEELRKDATGAPLLPRLTTCAAVLELGTDADPDASARRWKRELPERLRGCGCSGSDVEGLAALAALRTNFFGTPGVRSVPLRVTRDPSAPTVELPAAARGRDLIPRVEARGDVYQLRLGAP